MDTMGTNDNDWREAAIKRAIKDGAIPDDEPIYAVYIDYHCPRCGHEASGIQQAGAWSHLGSERTRPQIMECWYCENNHLQANIWFSEWDAPLENLPVSAIPDEYRDCPTTTTRNG